MLPRVEDRVPHHLHPRTLRSHRAGELGCRSATQTASGLQAGWSPPGPPSRPLDPPAGQKHAQQGWPPPRGQGKQCSLYWSKGHQLGHRPQQRGRQLARQPCSSHTCLHGRPCRAAGQAQGQPRPQPRATPGQAHGLLCRADKRSKGLRGRGRHQGQRPPAPGSVPPPASVPAAPSQRRLSAP